MANDIKKMIIIAGPNGSGKSTLAEQLLESGVIKKFLNADVIARGLDGGARGADIEAGKVMLSAVKYGINNGSSFAVETTLSGNIWRNFIKVAQNNGFSVEIHLVLVKDVEICLSRVQSRFKRGGHFIPEETVKRRFVRDKEQFLNTYKDIVNSWFIYDNSGDSAQLVAKSINKSEIQIKDKICLNQIIGDLI